MSDFPRGAEEIVYRQETDKYLQIVRAPTDSTLIIDRHKRQDSDGGSRKLVKDNTTVNQ